MGYPQKRVLKYPRNRKGYWTIREVATLLKMSYNQIYYFKVKTGQLKAIKMVNGERRIPKAYLYEYLEKYHIITNKKYGYIKRRKYTFKSKRECSAGDVNEPPRKTQDCEDERT